MKKLKSIDFKALFVDHGEKFGLVLITLIVLLALSSTSWSRFKDSPLDLKTKVDEAKARINSDANKWPQAKSDQFAVVDFNGKARDVFTALAASKYEFTTPLFWPLYRKKEKAREPEWSVVQELIAEPVRVVLLNQPQQTSVTADPAAGSTDAPRPLESTLRPPPGAPQTGVGPIGGGLSNPYAITPVAPKPPAGRGPAAGHGSATAPMSPMGGLDGLAVGGASGGSARGERVILVRGIVPLKDQVVRAMKALNLNYADASAAIDYHAFVLQRQTAVAGAEPWSGEWETLDITRTKEILKETEWDDADPVPPDLQDTVLTSPLPRRLLHYWADSATHPRIKHFEPTEAEREQVAALTAKIMEAAEQLNIQQPKAKGGFADITNDIRQTTKSVLKMEGFDFAREMGSMNAQVGGARMRPSDMQDRLTATGRLYLFRFLDFQVEPGMAYRYRVKLVLKNPNYKRGYDEVENEAFTKNELCETDWSNISNPAVVKDTVHYFLKDVERDPVRDEKHISKRPVANIAMYEWNSKLGTMLMDTLKISTVGQFIADKKKSLVLDPATPSFEEKEGVAYITEDMLVDASGDLELSLADHPDLQLKPEKGNKRDAKVGLLPEALVATGLGQLKELDPISELPEEKALEAGVNEERSNFKRTDGPKEERSVLDGGGFPGGGMMSPPTANPSRTAGGGNSRRRSQGGAPGGLPSAGGQGAPAGSRPPARPRPRL